MKREYVFFKSEKIEVISLNTIVVGSGASALNAADRLWSFGQRNMAIVTEGINMGTSRNTGSDKQTYYKLTLSGKEEDSINDMAKTFFEGGAMNGDIALVEAALSAQSFYHLVDIGVPFPHNSFGEYIGYRTDHDPRRRATSAGPLTSKYITEKLQEQIMQKNITIFDGYQVIAILTDKEKKNAIGLLTLNKNKLMKNQSFYTIFNSTNIIYGTGAPAGMYSSSVYPESQTGASGIAFEAGIMGKNLTESQYGIASTKFRWNLSGTYQQVIPRYISTDMNGNDEKEFLQEYFESPSQLLRAVFLKGYQWPFDSKKIGNKGSSIIDILVYNETVVKKRKVFLDFTKNPLALFDKNGEVNFLILDEEAYRYLANSNALFGKPIERLIHMNGPAVELYRKNGIDLKKEYLEIAVCAQHNNGGLYGNIWWESNVYHFFPVGEVNGTHGVYRPGGSALNSGQVGSYRAAQFISKRYNEEPLNVDELFSNISSTLEDKINLSDAILYNKADYSNVLELRKKIGDRMTKVGSHIRSKKLIEEAINDTLKDINYFKEYTKISSYYELPYAFQNYDLLITQLVYLKAIENYIEQGGKSRGSYIIYDNEGKLPVKNIGEQFRFSLDEKFKDKIQYVMYKGTNCEFYWNDVVSIPQSDDWFENIWNLYMEDKIIGR